MSAHAPHGVRHTLWRVIRDVNTENDGRSWCTVKVASSYLLIPGIPIFFCGVIYNTLQSHHFDVSSFAWGMSGIASVILLLATGVNVKARSDGMPPQPPAPRVGDGS